MGLLLIYPVLKVLQGDIIGMTLFETIVTNFIKNFESLGIGVFGGIFLVILQFQIKIRNLYSPGIDPVN